MITLRSDCSCRQLGVTGLDRLLELMNRGISQRTASLALWGWPSALADHAAAAVEAARAWGVVADLVLAQLDGQKSVAA